MTAKEVQILRELGGKLAEIAAKPEMHEKKKLWKQLGSLVKTRPLILIDEVPWNEMDFDGSLKCEITDPFWRGVEQNMRRKLYQYKYFPVDMVIEPYVNVSRAIPQPSFGIEIKEETISTGVGSNISSHGYKPVLADERDIEKISLTGFQENVAETQKRNAEAEQIFNGVIGYRMMGASMKLVMWDLLVRWIGPEETLMAMAERPEFIHACMDKLVAEHFKMIEQAERCGYLENRAQNVHSTYTYSEDITLSPPGSVPASECWVAGRAQIFSSVSKAMHKELEFDKVTDLFGKFRYTNYGCCEPLDNRIDLVDTIPNVRKVSISPWSDAVVCAEQMGGRYVMSRKPNPALVGAQSLDHDAVRDDIVYAIDACKRTNTPLEIILKDITTVKGDPKRLFEYGRIAMELANS